MRSPTGWRSRASRAAAAAGALWLLGLPLGCLKVKEHLTLRADGTGTLRLETRCLAPAAVVAMLKQRGMTAPDLLSFPPLTRDDAARLFPGEGFEVKVTDVRADDAVSGTLVEVAFKDITALMASPYGHARSLSVAVEGEALRVASLSGLLPAVAASETEEAGMFPALVELRKKRHLMAAEFTLTLPGTVDASNGTHQGNTVVWTMDWSKTKDLAEATRLFGMAMRASCPRAGLAFAPAAPARLGLVPFQELKEGPTADKTRAPDAKAVAAAARFVPVMLETTRTFDLTGEHGGWGNTAVLSGAIVLPRKFAPNQWGGVRLEEAVDDQGRSLLRERDEDAYGRHGARPDYAEARREKEAGADVTHFVSLSFGVPRRTVKVIARIRAHAVLHYFGSREIVKLPAVFPVERVRDARRPATESLGGSAHQLASPALARLGLKVTIDYAARRQGATQFSLSAEGNQSALEDVQLFDARGAAWPTFPALERGGGASTYGQVLVPGTPEAPFSLALLVAGGGIEVKVPIRLENIAIAGQGKASDAATPGSD